jgi:hypothetical protein
MAFNPALLDQIAGEISRGKCVLFVGAGLSVGAGLPNWEGLLRRLINHPMIDASIRQDLEAYLAQKQFLFVGEVIKGQLNKTDYRNALRDTFKPAAGVVPQENHRLLTQLPFGAVITTNYDRLLETAFTNAGQELEMFTSVDPVPFTSIANRGNRYLLKAHGTAERPDTIILAQSDYDSIIFANPVYRDHLKSLFRNSTVLFLGFGLSDPELRLLLSQITVESNQPTGPHYALVDKKTIASPLEHDLLYRQYGIKVISYAPATNAHTEVTDFLKALVARAGQSQPPNTDTQPSSPQKTRIRIPVIVAAMNSTEADELFSGRLFEGRPELAQRQAVFTQLQQIVAGDSRFQDVQQRYGAKREDWRPPNQKIPWMGWNNQHEDRTIAEIVTEVMTRLDSETVAFEPKFVSEEFFSTDVAIRYAARENLNIGEDNMPIGAVVIVDAISLFFDRLWTGLSGLLGNPLNYMFVHSAIGFNTHPLNQLLGESFFRLPELQTAVYGYIEKLEMRYEMMAGDPLTLRRWLTVVLPDITTPRSNPNNKPFGSSGSTDSIQSLIFRR